MNRYLIDKVQSAGGGKYRTDRRAGKPDSAAPRRRNKRLGSGRPLPRSHDSRGGRNRAGRRDRPDRAGVVAVVPDQQTLDRVRGIIQDLQIGDELQPEATFDAALRRMREGAAPRVLLLDLSDSPTPIAVLSARAIGRRRRR